MNPSGFMRPCTRLSFFLTLAWLLAPVPGAQSDEQGPIALGPSIVTLNGPWKFRTGDNPAWSDPSCDDSGWERVDLTPLPGATDGDVGLTDYVPGWTARGHQGYGGYAWYRLRLSMTPLPEGAGLALLGPWAVESAYQVYVNGRLVGGVGDFAHAPPTAYGNHYPRIFALPPETARGGPVAIAIRVWLGPWAAPRTGSGGIHIAPAIGARDAVTAQYRLQWLKIFEGYAVDVVPALLFVLMAVLALCLAPCDRTDRAYVWLAVALMLSAIQRGNQAFFFWWQIESVQMLVYLIIALVGSLSLAAWLMAWRSWFKVERPAWLPLAIAGLTLILILAQILSRPWLFETPPAHPVVAVAKTLIGWVRVAFLLALGLILYRGVSRARDAWFAVPAVLAIAVVLFASELAALQVPGIWFPFGVGLSLGECASVVFDLLLAALLVRRLWHYAQARDQQPRGLTNTA